MVTMIHLVIPDLQRPYRDYDKTDVRQQSDP